MKYWWPFPMVLFFNTSLAFLFPLVDQSVVSHCLTHVRAGSSEKKLQQWFNAINVSRTFQIQRLPEVFNLQQQHFYGTSSKETKELCYQWFQNRLLTLCNMYPIQVLERFYISCTRDVHLRLIWGRFLSCAIWWPSKLFVHFFFRRFKRMLLLLRCCLSWEQVHVEVGTTQTHWEGFACLLSRSFWYTLCSWLWRRFSPFGFHLAPQEHCRKAHMANKARLHGQIRDFWLLNISVIGFSRKTYEWGETADIGLQTSFWRRDFFRNSAVACQGFSNLIMVNGEKETSLDLLGPFKPGHIYRATQKEALLEMRVNLQKSTGWLQRF